MAAKHDENLAKDLPDFDSLWNYDRPDETEAKFREILAQAETLGGDKRYQAELLTQIARAEGLQKRFEEGHRTLDRANAMLEPVSPRIEVRSLLERGRLFNSSGNPSQAIPLFQKAFGNAEAAGEDALAVDAAHMLGICETPQRAMEWNLRALAAAEASGNPKVRRWAGALLNNIGWTHHDQKEFAKALDFFNRALAFREDQGNAREIRIARWAVARTLRSLGRVAEALAMQQDLQSQWAKDGDEDGYVFEELGECLLALGSDHAGKWFAEAYRALSGNQRSMAPEPKRLQRLKELASQ
jgi:tetratricopeptide (TPR) repeat protein